MAQAVPVGGTVVAKIGSSTLVDADGRIDAAFVQALCDQIATLVHGGIHMVLVSSGAVAAGFERLGFSQRPSDMATLQACASAGQVALAEAYSEVLAEHGISCGQVLLTRRDVIDRSGYLHARTTLLRLIELGCVPVVNENDTVSVAEFTFGDNDTLGAITATLVSADLYVILSDVEGLYTANPQDNPDAQLISHVSKVDSHISAMAKGSSSTLGTGGMATKIRAARATLAAGIPTVICRGRSPHVLVDVVGGQAVGTRFEPDEQAHETGRKLWIGLAEIPQGSIKLDAGALEAVQEHGASILPVGITESMGTYSSGDVVNVLAPDDTLVGRGVVRYSSEEMKQIRGLRLDVIRRFMPEKNGMPAIHRDELLIF
ncbi:MAG: glutamate 5-kinase [Atopobiaceae bacterium]|jgi:glutamate 5-kinase|nr:glutamate 5-kinase [Olegusella sp.]MCI1934482.1 glutamate 5-kinase [Atopobiaceae bacterium]NLH91306.1 glutamate 5-kinase [Atopobium sp.]